MFVPNFKLSHFTPDALRGCVYMSETVRDRKVKQCLKECQLSLSKFDFLITYRHKKKQANHEATRGHRYTHAHKYKCLPLELQKVWQNVRNQVVRWKHRKSQSDRSECGWAGKEVWMWKKKVILEQYFQLWCADQYISIRFSAPHLFRPVKYVAFLMAGSSGSVWMLCIFLDTKTCLLQVLESTCCLVSWVYIMGRKDGKKAVTLDWCLPQTLSSHAHTESFKLSLSHCRQERQTDAWWLQTLFKKKKKKWRTSVFWLTSSSKACSEYVFVAE